LAVSEENLNQSKLAAIERIATNATVF